MFWQLYKINIGQLHSNASVNSTFTYFQLLNDQRINVFTQVTHTLIVPLVFLLLFLHNNIFSSYPTRETWDLTFSFIIIVEIKSGTRSEYVREGDVRQKGGEVRA